MKQYMRYILGVLAVAIVLAPIGSIAQATTTKKSVATKSTAVKKVITTKKVVAKKKTTKKKVKKKKEVLNLNPPLIDPLNPPGGR